MWEQPNNKEMRKYVLSKIALRQEGASWDFKRQWYSEGQKSELLHDIICMANSVDHVDGHIIIGVDEEDGYSVCGVEADSNRKNTQAIVTFLKDKKFASSVRPIAYVTTLHIYNHLVDVITIPDSSSTPFYLTEKFQKLFPYHIYTRIQDTNTDIDKSADPDITEKLWKKRFHIDESALERAFSYLKHPEDWIEIDDEFGFYYRYFPEFKITRESLSLSGYEYYHCTQTDPIPGWYDVIIQYYQTSIYTCEGISMDGGRYFTVVPDWDLLNVADPPVKFSFYISESDTYTLHTFFDQKCLTKNDRLSRSKFLDIVPVFANESEKQNYWEYAKRHYWEKRKNRTIDSLPPFVEYIGTGQSLDAIKDDYLDAMTCMSLLNEFRNQKSNRKRATMK